MPAPYVPPTIPPSDYYTPKPSPVPTVMHHALAVTGTIVSPDLVFVCILAICAGIAVWIMSHDK